ncbi:MAG: nickel-binding protein [Acidimicrobiales bacterium]
MAEAFGQLELGALGDAARGQRIRWEHSYVGQDKTFCVYLAESSAMIDVHTERNGFPASVVTESQHDRPSHRAGIGILSSGRRVRAARCCSSGQPECAHRRARR